MTSCTTWTQPHTPVVSACPSWGLRSPTRCRWCTCPHHPLHLLVEHAIQRLEERSQLTWDEDDDGVRPPLEVGNEIFVSVALEVVQYQDTWALLDDSSVVRTELPALRDPKGALPSVTPAFVLHDEIHASRGVAKLGAVHRKDLCRPSRAWPAGRTASP